MADTPLAQDAGTPLARDAYRTGEVAARLHVDESTVRRWARTGVIQRVKVGGTVLVPKSEIDRILTPVAPATQRRADPPANPPAEAGRRQRARSPRPTASPPNSEGPCQERSAGRGGTAA